MTGQAWLVALLAETLRDPQSAARRLVALNPPNEARWIALALTAVLALLETRVALLLFPALGQAGPLALFSGGWTGVPLQFLSLVIVATAITFIGRLWGGRGQFADAILLVAWMEFVLTLAQAVQIVALVVIPPLGMLLGVAAIALFIWLLVNLIAALHEFTDILKVLIGTVVSFVLLVTAVAILLTTFGLVPPLPKG
jgi:hypothetical protein